MAFAAENRNGHPRDRPRYKSLLEKTGTITLVWEGINVYAPVINTACCGRASESGPRKQILHDVSGVARPGSLLAIMGASGAGKSTLLNVLTGRNQSNLQIEGSVKVNGMNVAKSIKALSAYVQQDDLFVGMLKVREHLWFQALLRMEQDISLKDRRLRVEEVLEEMGLAKCADDYIGQPGTREGISRGEMKRLSFASELLTNPQLMFCDEPTSGIDSYMAETVVRTLQRLAANGRTILCTIHQPSSQAFALFDQLLLIADGRVAYLGPASGAIAFFANCGYPCPTNYNPADHFVRTLAVRPGSELECYQRITRVASAYATSDWAATACEIATRRQDTLESERVAIVTAQLERQSPYRASWGRQMQALLWRCWLAQARNTSVFVTRILQTIIVAIIILTLYFNQQYNNQGVKNLNGALFLLVVNTSFSNFFPVLQVFPLGMPIFYREHNNGMYRADAYFLCKNLAEIPLLILLTFGYTTITYWSIGLERRPAQFLIACLVLLLVCNASVSLAYFVATASGRTEIASVVSVPAILPFMLFGGFYLNPASVPVWLVWMRYLSWFSYGYEALIVNQWRGVLVVNKNCPAIQNSSTCFTSGKEIIRSLNFSEDKLKFNIGMLCLLIIILRSLAFAFFWLRARMKSQD